MGSSVRLLLVAGSLLVAACGAQADRLDISGNAADVRFVLKSEDSSRRCIDRLTVAPATDPEGIPVWRVIAANPAACVTGLRYGEPGAAFGQEAGPDPLPTGVPYRARASGTGFSVVRDFTVTPEGIRQAEP